ncbi:MAG: hypothetical protein JWO65_326 [Sphingomonas bacterium]|nr:hypothetical protein [Sphingomonas bacterium]
MRRAMMTAAMILIATPASAQLLGRGGGVPLGGLTGGLLGGTGGQSGIVGGLSAPLTGVGDTLSSLSPGDLLSLRRERLHALVHDNRPDLDIDNAGNPVRRDEIVALGLASDALDRAKAAGFTVIRHEKVEGLGIDVTILAPPKGKAARKAIDALRKGDPQGRYTLDHVYEPARAPLAPASGPAAGSGSAPGAKIGLIDGGVGNHPAFAGAAIEQRGFAGAPRPSGHGTAVASLMIGRAGAFRGAAPGTALLVADVYGGSAANGSADAIVRAMGWLAAKGARVINISLVGPPNALLEAGVVALTAKGILIVAAVGNDGPAAPPQYPASYPGVVSVTGVDAKGKPLIEAGRPLHLDFAAPGADMAGAVPGGGWEVVRGTSFAAPLVSASLARLDRGDAARTLDALSAEARPVGGRTGRGIVCGACATPPRAVGLK